MRRFIAALAFIAWLPACGEATHREAPATTKVAPTTAPFAAAKSPFANLADEMSYDCIKSATDSHVTRQIVYLRCIGAHNALLNAKTSQRYNDDNAVTASVLEIYAAYALRNSSSNRTQEYYALLGDADRRLKALGQNASAVQFVIEPLRHDLA
jgi:hypothetical protein